MTPRLVEPERYGQALLPHHARLLAESAIAPAVAAARGYRTVTTKATLRALGFTVRQSRVPALLIPVFGVTGEIANHQIRPDDPRVDGRGKATKYETVAGSRMVLDVHPHLHDRLGDPHIPLWFTEGIRKGDAAVSAGLCCVALLGVWNWRGTNEHGGKVALPEFESIALNGRDTFVVFDSDATIKPPVRNAEDRLAAFLQSRGAHVRIVRLPAGPGGVKVGLDDFLAAGHTVDDMLVLASDGVPVPSAEDADAPYWTGPHGLAHRRRIRDDIVEEALTNFDARIVTDIVEDDGAEQRRVFEIDATLHNRHRLFRVAAVAFPSMTWATEHLGAGAVVYPGMGTREHARTAIQILSHPAERLVFAHTGWRATGGQDVYLHAGGAIGPDGPVLGVEVRLDAPLDTLCLPVPPDGAALVAAVRASVRLADVAVDRVSFPILGAIYRAPLGEVDLSLHLTGPTGVFKTELAALAQAHWGSRLDARHLPGSWSSTANANEALAFIAKDAILVVDDFAPAGSQVDVSRLHRDADRLLRAQGNRSGRSRMRADTSLRPPRPPRGLIVSTGEDVPRGASLGARMVVVSVRRGDVPVAALTQAQDDAKVGLHAGAMAGFVQWLAQTGASGRLALRTSSGDVMPLGARGAHRRATRNLQALAAGVSAFLTFAEEAGAITAGERDRLWDRAVQAFRVLIAEQTTEQVAADPAMRFGDLLASALLAGRAHVVALDGGAPPEPAAWGWRPDTLGWRPQGATVGWLDGDDLYLDPDSAYAAAQAAGNAVGEPLGVRPQTLMKRLFEAGMLASTEASRGRLTVRRVLHGHRHAVLHMRASHVLEPAHVAHMAHHDGRDASDEAHHGEQVPLQEPEPVNVAAAPRIFGADIIEPLPPVQEARP